MVIKVNEVKVRFEGPWSIIMKRSSISKHLHVLVQYTKELTTCWEVTFVRLNVFLIRGSFKSDTLGKIVKYMQGRRTIETKK